MTVSVPDNYNPNVDTWTDLVGQADEALGSELITGEAADKLIGVPLIIYRVTYRDGIQRQGVKWRDDYVSCEAVIAPMDVLEERARRGRLNLQEISVDADEHIVFNDGSTGIYRQVTQYLAVKNLIELPSPLVTVGGKGESSYDLPRSQWVAGADAATAGISVRLYCPRGLRYSEYTNDYAPDGSKTRYFGLWGGCASPCGAGSRNRTV